jgi:hypothetical protein
MRNPTHRATAPDLLHFAISAEDRRAACEELRAILLTHVALERTTSLRHFFVHLLAAMGGLFVACWLFPDAASGAVRETLLWIWGLCCLAALISATVEWELHTDEARLLARNHSGARRITDDR